MIPDQLNEYQQWVYLEDVGYSSTVAAFRIVGDNAQLSRAINVQICSNGISISMVTIPLVPHAIKMETIGGIERVCLGRIWANSYKVLCHNNLSADTHWAMCIRYKQTWINRVRKHSVHDTNPFKYSQIFLYLQMIGNFPSLPTKRLIRIEPNANTVSNIISCSIVAISSLVMQTYYY